MTWAEAALKMFELAAAAVCMCVFFLCMAGYFDRR